MEIQSIYQQAIKFATLKHLEKNQTIPGTNLPYVVHLSNVAMEVLVSYQISPTFNLEYALKIALLHDLLEDTSTTFEEISNLFGSNVAEAVLALTKNDTLPKAEKMLDSLKRIKGLEKEVWIVKLADRITNLQEPPKHWVSLKKSTYRQEAIQILLFLQGGNTYLEERLQIKINEYEKYI